MIEPSKYLQIKAVSSQIAADVAYLIYMWPRERGICRSQRRKLAAFTASAPPAL
jgi:hypothetical protein